jgi:AraC-like DNA-binding protein
MPADDRALAVARMVLDDPSNRETFAALARRGYESTSAFINAFKRTFGVTPGRYLND